MGTTTITSSAFSMINTTITVDCTCYLFSPLHQYKFLLIHICPSLHKLPVFFYLSITLTWIHHRCTCVPHPEPLSHLPPHPIPLGHPSAPAPSTLSHASNLDWRFISHLVIYMFQCHSPKSSHPCPFPQSPKNCSIHMCLFCCLAHRVIVTIFLNSIYMH